MPAWFTPFLLLLDALAVYRLTRLVTEDHLPFGPLRDRLNRQPDSLAAEWMTCGWCVSMYAGALVLGLHALLPSAWPYVAAVLAFSAVTGLLERL